MSLSFPLFGSPFWCHPVHSSVCLSILLSPCSFCFLTVYFIVSLSILLLPCLFYCLPVHSAVSLSILLSHCSFCYLAVHSIISLSILLYPFPLCCLTEKRLRREVEEAKTRGRSRTEAVNFWSVVFAGIVFHGRYHRSLFNKVCLICPSDVLFKKNHEPNFQLWFTQPIVELPPTKKTNQKMVLTNNVPVAWYSSCEVRHISGRGNLNYLSLKLVSIFRYLTFSHPPSLGCTCITLAAWSNSRLASLRGLQFH